MSQDNVTELYTPESAVRRAITEAVMTDFEADGLLNSKEHLASVVYEMASENAIRMASKDDDERVQAEQLDGLLADLHFLLTKCQITLPNGWELM